MVSRGLIFPEMDYWKEYLPGPSKIETDARQEWFDSRPGVIKMVNHILETRFDPDWRILDAGCKEGWTNEYLLKFGCDVKNQIGVEISEEQVDYAHKMGRHWVRQGDICDLKSCLNGDKSFDLVICRHVLGLTRDAFLAMAEMWSVVKRGGYLYVITHIPGNKKKHYSYIKDKKVIDDWLRDPVFLGHSKIYYGWNPKFNPHQDNRRKELVVYLRKDSR